MHHVQGRRILLQFIFYGTEKMHPLQDHMQTAVRLPEILYAQRTYQRIHM